MTTLTDSYIISQCCTLRQHGAPFYSRTAKSQYSSQTHTGKRYHRFIVVIPIDAIFVQPSSMVWSMDTTPTSNPGRLVNHQNFKTWAIKRKAHNHSTTWTTLSAPAITTGEQTITANYHLNSLNPPPSWSKEIIRLHETEYSGNISWTIQAPRS